MADNSTILLSSNDKGDETRVDLGVLEVILGIAARKVDGVSEMRGLALILFLVVLTKVKAFP